MVGGSIAACDRGARDDRQAPPEPGGTLRVAVFEPLDFMNPVLASGPVTLQLLEHVTPPLATLDEHRRARPRAARDFLDSGGTIDFLLRRLHWEDGAPVVARDFVLTTELARDHRTRSPERRRLDLVRDVQAVNDSLLRIEFAILYSRRLRDALWMPLPSHAVVPNADPTDLGAWPLTQRPLSCGPFRVARNTTLELVLERNARCDLGPARLQRVDVRTLDVEAAVRGFRAGTLDVIDDLPAARVREVRAVRGTRIVALVGRSYLFIGWNLRDARLADESVRRAAAHAVDMQRVIRELTLGQGEPSHGPLVPAQDFADTSAVLRYDPAAATRLLERAGWRDLDGDGIRERRGARLEMHVLANVETPLRVAAAEQVARDLKRVGILLHVRPLTPELLSQRLQSHAFECFVGEWFPGPEDELESVWRSDAADNLNFVGYANGTADSLLTQLRHELSDGERAERLAQLQHRVYADQPYLFLFLNPRFVALSARVHGAEPGFLSTFQNLPEWWVPRALQGADTLAAAR